MLQHPEWRELLDKAIFEERVAAYGAARSLKTAEQCAEFQGRLGALDSLEEALKDLDHRAKELKDAPDDDVD